jgi:hypothetical protein
LDRDRTADPATAALTRRAVLLGAGRLALAGAGGAVLVGGGGLLAGCGGDDGGADRASGGGSDDDVRFLVPFFATGENEMPILRPGVPQRMPWGVADGEGIPLPDLPAEVTVTITDEAGTRVGEPIVVARHGDGTPYPYYPLRTDLAQPGRYRVSMPFDDRPLERTVVLAPPEQVRLVQPGERAVPVMTPTVTDAREVDPICTREPACPFHTNTLSEALGSGQPTAFLISTPAFCQTAVCGPVLELLIEETPGRPLQVVHAEVYADAVRTGDPLRAKLSEATRAYQLSFEPSLVVADANGIVVDRLDFLFDRAELRAVLDRVS